MLGLAPQQHPALGFDDDLGHRVRIHALTIENIRFRGPATAAGLATVGRFDQRNDSADIGKCRGTNFQLAICHNCIHC